MTQSSTHFAWNRKSLLLLKGQKGSILGRLCVWRWLEEGHPQVEAHSALADASGGKVTGTKGAAQFIQAPTHPRTVSAPINRSLPLAGISSEASKTMPWGI